MLKMDTSINQESTPIRLIKWTLLLVLLSLSANSWAIDADYTKFTVNGTTYDVPIPNKDTRSDYYLLHRAIEGDKYARELLLGGKQERAIFIGDIDGARWLVLGKNGEKVIEHKGVVHA